MKINIKTMIPYIKKTLVILYKCGIATAGITAFTNPVSAIIAGAIAVSSAVSAFVKDNNFKKVMKLVNVIACNIGNAKNDSKTNS